MADVERALESAGLELAHFSKPLHVLNLDRAWKPSEGHVVVHASDVYRKEGRLPGCSFVRICGKLYAPSPELCFLQMADFLDVDNLVIVGCELCSMYCYKDESPGEPIYWGSSANQGKGSESLPKIKPLIASASIAAFVEKCANVRGKRKSQRALRYITPNAASPMEIMLAQGLCLPNLLGGYGLPAPVLNREIPLGRYAGKLTRRGSLVPDLFWPKSKLDVEYMSTKHHATRKDLARDAERQNAMGHLGIRVIDVTWDQFTSLRDMDAVALAVGKHLRKRVQPRSDRYSVRKIYLHSKMLHYIRTGQFLQPDLYA